MSSLTFELCRALQYVALDLATESALKRQLQELGLVEKKSLRVWVLTERGKSQLAQLLMHKSHRRNRGQTKG